MLFGSNPRVKLQTSFKFGLLVGFFFFTRYLFVKLFGIVISDKIPVLKQFYSFRWAAIVAATMKHKYC